LGLPVHNRPESQDFLEGEAAGVLDLNPLPGPIRSLDGRILGEHKGISLYTIGQRKGLGISSAEPLYVVAIEAGRNALVVGPKQALFSAEFVAGGMNWIAVDGPAGIQRAAVRIRYRHAESPADLFPEEGNSVRVRFVEPQMSITPGQAAVFYEGDLVLGGGIIEGAFGPEEDHP
jgi:tRNA-specific 2-thiouridylase